MKLHQLTQSEKILLVEQLWDSIRADAEICPLTAAQKDEIDRRLADYELNPDEGDSWAAVKARILNQ